MKKIFRNKHTGDVAGFEFSAHGDTRGNGLAMTQAIQKVAYVLGCNVLELEDISPQPARNNPPKKPAKKKNH